MSQLWAIPSSSRGDPVSASRSWSTRLENVLEDRTALDAFREWMVSTHPHAGEPLDLHFAIVGYQQKCRSADPKSIDLARTIYHRHGTCKFIPERARQECGQRIKAMAQGGNADPRVFEQCLSPLDEFLRRQHEQFVGSDEFVELFNRFSLEEIIEVPRHNTLPRSSRSSHSHRSFGFFPHRDMKCATTGPVPLTADALIRSQQDRENQLGALERMYPPPMGGLRMPYVCHATTSQNDSAVSSSFSSDANGSQRTGHRLHVIKEEHIRGNPVTQTIPRVDQGQKMDGASIWDHATEEGRKRFAAVLHEKLQRESERRRRNDATEQQLRDIENRKCTARDAVSNTVVDPVEDDDDIDRMRDDSTSQKASASRSPRGCGVVTGGGRGLHSPKSPERSRATTATTGFSPFIPGVYPPTTSMGFAPPPVNNGNFFSLPANKDRFYRGSSLYTSGVESMYDVDRISSPRFTPRNASAKPTPSKSSSSNTVRGPSKSSTPLVTLSCKGVDGVPIVAHVAAKEMTLKEFRRHFAISSQSGIQFFFKTECEDGSAPYQLLLINDDNAVLPFFEGKIAAECKAFAH